MANKSIGALWLKKAKSGLVFMSGEITIEETKHQIVVFKNDKQKDNQPDYRILKSEPYNPKKDKAEAIQNNNDIPVVEEEYTDPNAEAQIVAEEERK
jgi:uncharacterized protein (DUF736 family)